MTKEFNSRSRVTFRAQLRSTAWRSTLTQQPEAYASITDSRYAGCASGMMGLRKSRRFFAWTLTTERPRERYLLPKNRQRSTQSPRSTRNRALPQNPSFTPECGLADLALILRGRTNKSSPTRSEEHTSELQSLR